MVVVAHPDDETVGAAARLARLRERVTLVHVTDGSPFSPGNTYPGGCRSRVEYSRVRRAELLAALGLCGIPASRALTAGCVEQEAALHLPGVARHLAELFLAQRPEVVVTHAYEGAHPDHDATAFAVHVACELLHLAGERAPVMVELMSHQQTAQPQPAEFLPRARPVPITCTLTDEERALKHRMLTCFSSRRSGLRQVRTGVERFRLAPYYPWTHPPHDGVLLYERFSWAMPGEQFRRLAREAMLELKLGAAQWA